MVCRKKRRDRMKYIIVFGLVFSVAAISAQAQTVPAVHSANDLVTECAIAVGINEVPAHDGVKGLQGGFCFGYITGYANASLQLGGTLFCPPQAVTVNQMIKVFLKYMDEHPVRGEF